MAGLFSTALARRVVPGPLGDLRSQPEQAAHRGQRRHRKRHPRDHLDQRAARLRSADEAMYLAKRTGRRRRPGCSTCH